MDFGQQAAERKRGKHEDLFFFWQFIFIIIIIYYYLLFASFSHLFHRIGRRRPNRACDQEMREKSRDCMIGLVREIRGKRGDTSCFADHTRHGIVCRQLIPDG